MRRAANLLLAHREELSPALARELDSYKVTLDALHPEAVDDFTDTEGVLNLLPTQTAAPTGQPLDGGRVRRASSERRSRATRTAIRFTATRPRRFGARP